MSTQLRILADGYRFNENEESGQRGKLVCVDDVVGVDSDAVIDLPTIGHKWSEISGDLDHRKCLLRDIDVTFFGGDARHKQYELSYSTKAKDDDTNREPDPGAEFLPRALDVGSEVMSWDATNQTGLVWATGGGAIEQVASFRIITGKVSIQKVHTTYEKPFGNIRTYGGSINSAEWFNCGAEQLMLIGASINEYINNKGNKRFRTTYRFSFRFVPGYAAVGWNHLYKKHAHGWDKTNPLLYPTANFKAIFGSV